MRVPWLKRRHIGIAMFEEVSFGGVKTFVFLSLCIVLVGECKRVASGYMALGGCHRGIASS